MSGIELRAILLEQVVLRIIYFETTKWFIFIRV